MLQASDYHYLVEMERQGLTPDKNVLKEYENYFQLIVDNVAVHADAQGMLGFCRILFRKRRGCGQNLELLFRKILHF